MPGRPTPNHPTKLTVGISTCPNDTFAFHGLLTQRVRCEGLDLDFWLGDVQELNERMSRGQFDIAKVSFAAALSHADEWVILPSGSALGFGVGPVVIGPPPGRPLEADAARRILAPGPHTTATLLHRVFHPQDADRVEHCVFSEILPSLARGEASAGLCIHEGRFTYPEHGLTLIEDLGETWEHATGMPLPLGGIVARRNLDESTLDRVQSAIRRSIEYADEHRDECEATMARHARELSSDAIWKHVELYVNDATRSLGAVGRDALRELDRRARHAGVIPGVERRLEVWRELG